MPRKQYDYHYIYKTTNLINNKFYIGMHSTSDLEDGYTGSGKRLWYSIKKYGRENFKMEILEFLPDRSSLKEREKQIVNSDLLKEELCMNLKLGGDGGFINEEHQRKAQIAGGKATKSEETKQKFGELSKSLHAQGKFKYDTFTGKTHTIESRDKISKANSESQKGERNSQFGTCWITKDSKTLKVKKQFLENFLKDGWKRGR
jgi:group I intron endonuclease